MAELQGRALVTGGGRGIGANIARELSGAGMEVWVTGRTAEQVEEIAAEIGGHALVGDVTSREDVERWVREAEPIDLLVANAGTGTHHDDEEWEFDLDAWWRTFEVNVLGVHLSCRAAIPGMLERGDGRIVIVGSGASYLPGRERDRVHVVEGGGRPLRRDAGERAPRPDSRLRDQPGARANRDDGRAFRGRRSVDTAGARAATRAGARLR